VHILFYSLNILYFMMLLYFGLNSLSPKHYVFFCLFVEDKKGRIFGYVCDCNIFNVYA